MRKINLTMTHDAQADACYIYLYKNKGDVAKSVTLKLTTKAVTDTINLDFTQEGKLIGIEILNAEAQLDVL